MSNTIVRDLTALYVEQLKMPRDFYETVRRRVKSSEEGAFNPDQKFLSGISPKGPAITPVRFCAKAGETRIDVPVWYGDPNAKHRVVVVGESPRDTDCEFNVVRSKKVVFACCFGADQWNSETSVHGKPQLKYLKAFQPLLRLENTFVLFTDAVKVCAPRLFNHEEVVTPAMMKAAYCDKWCSVLKSELEIVNPCLVILLGTRVAYVAKDKLPDARQVPHPAHGQWRQCRAQIQRAVKTHGVT